MKFLWEKDTVRSSDGFENGVYVVIQHLWCSGSSLSAQRGFC